MKKVFQFMSNSGLGGLEHMVANISTLVKGYDFTCISPKGPINDYFKKLNISHINIKNMNPIRVRHIIKAYKPDIVQGHDVKASLALACNAHLCHKYGIKIISQIHNDDPRMRKYFGLRSLLYAISTPFYDNVIMVSRPILNNYVYNDLIKNKTTIIYNVVNPFEIKKMLPILSYKKKWDCIFLGRLAIQKDPLRFVYIIKELKKYNSNIQAIIVGNGPLYNKVHECIINFKLENNITMVGFKRYPFKYLKESKVFIMTSRFEGLPVAVLESLLLGTPVISTPVGDVKSIINNSCGAIVTSNKNFIQKIKKFLYNDKLYKVKSINAKKRSKKINDINKFIRLYRNVYKS